MQYNEYQSASGQCLQLLKHCFTVRRHFLATEELYAQHPDKTQCRYSLHGFKYSLHLSLFTHIGMKNRLKVGMSILTSIFKDFKISQKLREKSLQTKTHCHWISHLLFKWNNSRLYLLQGEVVDVFGCAVGKTRKMGTEICQQLTWNY